jgi:hypothetical protein
MQMKSSKGHCEELDRWENEGGALRPQNGDIKNVTAGSKEFSQSEGNGERNEKIKAH